MKKIIDELLLERIDILEIAQNSMWKNYNNEKDPYKKGNYS